MRDTTEPYPIRQPMNHTPPPAIRADDAWYFITICAEGHRAWSVGTRNEPMNFDSIANAILSTARWYHEHGKWRLGLMLVMPDHLHFIVHFPPNPDTSTNSMHDDCGHAGRVTLPVQLFKSFLIRKYGISCQRDFFDTRLRDDEHYAEKWRYIVRNPVTRGLVATPRDWPHSIAFNRDTGEELAHR